MSRDMSRDKRNNGVKIQQGIIHLLSVISDGYYKPAARVSDGKNTPTITTAQLMLKFENNK